jgi:hypothetical protein
LVGPDAAAARAPDLEPVVKFLDPILDVAARSRPVRRRTAASAADS